MIVRHRDCYQLWYSLFHDWFSETEVMVLRKKTVFWERKYSILRKKHIVILYLRHLYLMTLHTSFGQDKVQRPHRESIRKLMGYTEWRWIIDPCHCAWSPPQILMQKTLLSRHDSMQTILLLSHHRIVSYINHGGIFMLMEEILILSTQCWIFPTIWFIWNTV